MLKRDLSMSPSAAKPAVTHARMLPAVPGSISLLPVLPAAARGPREMHDAVCANCGAACKVPFEPREDRPVYCSECFANMKAE